ncbi:MAG: TetR/AcrR family transcriptional regulator [bacterium]
MDDLKSDIDKDSTRQKILNTAIQEFANFGKAGARVDRIAAQAGVNKAMIYYHFNSKDNLYYASITEHITNTAVIIHQRISADISLEEMIRELVDVYFRLFNSSNYFKKILIRELAENNSPIINKIAETINQMGIPNILKDKLLTEMEKGRVKKHDVKQALASLISMNIGFFIISPIISKILNLDDFDNFLTARKEAVVDLFLNGVLIK